MGERPSVRVYGDNDLLDAMERLADEHDRTLSAEWRRAAERYLERHVGQIGEDIEKGDN